MISGSIFLNDHIKHTPKSKSVFRKCKLDTFLLFLFGLSILQDSFQFLQGLNF